MNYPKVLVLSIPAWNSTSNTFSILFEGWPKDKIANIYLRGGKPSSNVCSEYFWINEAAVIKSIIKRSLKTGKRVEAEEENKKSSTSKKQIKHSEILSMVRDCLWMLGRWKTPELKEFIKNFNPDVILFPIEGYSHFNNISRYAVSLTGKKAVGYLWDDNFTYKPHPYGLTFLFRRFFIRKNVKKTVSICNNLLSINKKMQKEVKEVFGRDSVIITKGISTENIFPENKERSFPIKLCYAGKLIIGRDKTLALLSKAINEVGSDKFELSIYSQTVLDEKTQSEINISGNVLKGAVPFSELEKIYKENDILVFAEALEGKCRNSARLSFSTKITDYLKAGKAILALAPSDIAPTEALLEQNSVLFSDNYEKTVKLLKGLIKNPDIINNYSEKTVSLAKENYDLQEIKKLLYKELI